MTVQWPIVGHYFKTTRQLGYHSNELPVANPTEQLTFDQSDYCHHRLPVKDDKDDDESEVIHDQTIVLIRHDFKLLVP